VHLFEGDIALKLLSLTLWAHFTEWAEAIHEAVQGCSLFIRAEEVIWAV